MLRRFSTSFRKDRKKGDTQLNDITEKSANVKEPVPEHVVHAAEQESVNSTFAEFAQVLHAAKRPLPTQTGDGSYLTKEEPSGFMGDLKSMGFKDLKTLREVIQRKATGALVDDKTYIMERVIQVWARKSSLTLFLTACSS